MNDVGFFWQDPDQPCPDLVIENGDLKADQGLETAMMISLFSDKRVRFEQLPRGEDNQRGWWADTVSEPIDDEIGSTLWRIITIGKVTNAAVVEVENAIRDGLQWLLDDGIAQEVLVSAERTEDTRIDAEISIRRPNGENIPFKFLWDGQAVKLIEGA